MHVGPEVARVCQRNSLKKHGFPKDFLVRKGWEFDRVYSQGKRLHGKGFTLVCRANDLGYSRIGISVHRKLKGAVRRNRIKRIIRESFRLQRDLYPSEADIVFAVRPDFALSSPAAVYQAVSPLKSRLRRMEEV